MIAAHMDEIWRDCTHIDEKGFLRFSNIGEILTVSLLIGQRVVFANGTLKELLAWRTVWIKDEAERRCSIESIAT